MIKDFLYDGRALSEFGYILLMENSEEQMDTSNMEIKNIKGARNDKSIGVGYQYGENLTATYLIMKDFCEFPDDELDLTDDDVSELTRWLCRKQYKWFKFIDDEDMGVADVWYQGYWTVKKEFVGDRVIGLQITLHTNAPYGYSRIVKHVHADNQFSINIHTDEEGYIYPDVTITVQEDGDLEFTNVTEGRVTEIKNCVAGETITILNADIQQIGSTNTAHDWIHEYNYKYPRFAVSYGNLSNDFNINLEAEIIFEYREIRKVGLK